MTKPEAYSVQQEEHDHEEGDRRTTQEPLSGSKKVKNRNHSRQNHGEGR
jgi:small acid-soluble spore protein P (minor)